MPRSGEPEPSEPQASSAATSLRRWVKPPRSSDSAGGGPRHPEDGRHRHRLHSRLARFHDQVAVLLGPRAPDLPVALVARFYLVVVDTDQAGAVDQEVTRPASFWRYSLEAILSSMLQRALTELSVGRATRKAGGRRQTARRLMVFPELGRLCFAVQVVAGAYAKARTSVPRPPRVRRCPARHRTRRGIPRSRFPACERRSVRRRSRRTQWSSLRDRRASTP